MLKTVSILILPLCFLFLPSYAVTNSNPSSKSYSKQTKEAKSSNVKETPSDDTVYLTPKADYTKCLIVNDSPNRSSNQNSFTFVNNCGTPVYINACIWDSFGETKLYQSGKSIPVGSFYKIYTLPFMKADKLEWTADYKNPEIPKLCQIKPKR